MGIDFGQGYAIHCPESYAGKRRPKRRRRYCTSFTPPKKPLYEQN